jgi:pyruvate/2-oxoglutarate dehydrogenase complex dihydrolipoamide dehydrogenase (E3) component
MAARLGARTVLVESARTGGDCLWTGCIPSKTILAAAKLSATQRTATGTGTPFPAVRTRVSEAITAIEPDDSPASLEAAGVTVMSGSARFTGPGGLRSREADPVPAGPHCDRQRSVPTVHSRTGRGASVTSETIWDVEQLPERLVVIGGGPIGCELGQAYARLGSQVVILPARKSREGGPGRGRTGARQPRSDGVVIIENTTVDRVSSEGGSAEVHTANGQSFPADVILVATGRKPRTEGLGLDSVGVTCDSAGYVRVDTAMRTSGRGIWAAVMSRPIPISPTWPGCTPTPQSSTPYSASAAPSATSFPGSRSRLPR